MLPNLLADFSQVKVMAGKLNAAATTGACHNFSLHWISLLYKDKGSTDEKLAIARMKELAAKKGEANPILQKIFGEVWTQESVENADKLMIALRGMKPSKEVGIPYSPYDQAKLVALLKAPKAAGMVYSFWFPGAIAGAQGAHSIAFFRNVEGKKGKMVPMDQNVLAFDPNFGECHIAEANLGKWLDALKKTYSGAINQQWLKYIEPNK